MQKKNFGTFFIKKNCSETKNEKWYKTLPQNTPENQNWYYTHYLDRTKNIFYAFNLWPFSSFVLWFFFSFFLLLSLSFFKKNLVSTKMEKRMKKQKKTLLLNQNKIFSIVTIGARIVYQRLMINGLEKINLTNVV